MNKFWRFQRYFGYFTVFILPLTLSQVWPNGSPWLVGIILAAFACLAHLITIENELLRDIKKGSYLTEYDL